MRAPGHAAHFAAWPADTAAGWDAQLSNASLASFSNALIVELPAIRLAPTMLPFFMGVAGMAAPNCRSRRLDGARSVIRFHHIKPAGQGVSSAFDAAPSGGTKTPTRRLA